MDNVSTKIVAFLGLGAMGSRMASHLLAAGHDVTVWNRSAGATDALVAKGAKAAGTPREAAAVADIVISMVSDDTASRGVWLDPASGACQGLRSGALAIECSTVTPAWVEELGQAVKARNAALIDAPVSGSRPQADAAQLVFMIGGAADIVERAMPVLKPMGAGFNHMGELSKGATFKLAINALFAAQLASMAELLAFLQKSGIDAEKVTGALPGFPVTSPAIAGAARLMAADNAPVMFPIDLMIKDLTYADKAAFGLGTSLPCTQAARDTFVKARQAGHGAENITKIASVFR